jgi:hypothetical protein
MNILKHIPNLAHCFHNCEREQIDTNMNFGYAVTSYESYTGEYFQNFSSKTEKLLDGGGGK